MGEELILGRNPVREALHAGRITRILVARGSRGAALDAVLKEARLRGVRVEETDRSRLDVLASRCCGGHGPARHQGVIGYAVPQPLSDIPTILAWARSRDQDPFVVVLDGVEDPMNLGSIIRSAEAAGVHGLILPSRRAAGVSPLVARASAGAIEYLHMAVVSNTVSALRELKDAGLWVAGLDASGRSLWEVDLKGPLALVVGGEGKGVGRLVRETCDFTVGIPMMGRIGSLNAGVAAAVAMYEAVRQRRASAGPALDRPESGGV